VGSPSKSMIIAFCDARRWQNNQPLPFGNQVIPNAQISRIRPNSFQQIASQAPGKDAPTCERFIALSTEVGRLGGFPVPVEVTYKLEVRATSRATSADSGRRTPAV
jgi:hypothetical protein